MISLQLGVRRLVCVSGQQLHGTRLCLPTLTRTLT